MQSDGNSFYRDVVLDSFNKASWNEYTILNQIYEKEICFIIMSFIIMILILITLHENAQ